jgi:hypothetical protein
MSSVTPGNGVVLNFSYIHTPYESDYKGTFYTTDVIFYLPGKTDTQGLILKGSYEKLDYENIFSPLQSFSPWI